jgi:hypothetical protein
MRSTTVFGLALGLGLVAVQPGCGSSGDDGAAAPAVTCTGGTAALTVKNYLSWCSVSVAGQPASAAGVQTVCVAPGTVALSATALAGFELGPAPWHRTDGDAGSGDLGTVTGTGQAASSATSVTVAATPACVWVCCPFTGGTGCPATDQCP